jgi:hypothetical protein
MDRHLEELLHSIIGSDPNGELDDEKRQTLMYVLLGLLSDEACAALWNFAASISDESMRSSLLHKLVPKIHVLSSGLVKRVADSIPEPYWRYSAVINIASRLLEYERASNRTDPRFREEALELIREAEANVPLVHEDDRSSIIWEAGLTLIRAGELDWAEKLAECRAYCAENTEVLLRVAKARAAKGEKDHALQIARKVAELANAGRAQNLTNRAFDVLDVSEFVAELGEAAEARHHLDMALKLAISGDADGDIDAHKCIRAIAVTLAKQGDTAAARNVANQIRLPALRDYALQAISEATAKAEKN